MSPPLAGSAAANRPNLDEKNVRSLVSRDYERESAVHREWCDQVLPAEVRAWSDRLLPCSGRDSDPANGWIPRSVAWLRSVGPPWSGKIPKVPSITGRIEVNLTVRDPDQSAAWYAELLGMQTVYDFVAPDGRMHYICLLEPESGLLLCLVGHVGNPGELFNEVHTGLDHLEFLVEHRDELDEWASRLDDLGIVHSGVKTPPYTRNAMLTFRDPDRIQLEFFWRSPTG